MTISGLYIFAQDDGVPCSKWPHVGNPGHLSSINMTIMFLAGELLQSCYKATNLFEICGPS